MKVQGKRYRAIAEYYDAEYADNETLRHDVGFFIGQLGRGRRDVLELAAGTGRAAIPIAMSGNRVVGVDYDEGLLEIGRKKAIAAGVKKGDLSLIFGDIREVDLGKRFDWVCLFFNTLLAFATVEELDRVLQTVRRHLKRSGRFWLDIFHPEAALFAGTVQKDLEPLIFRVEALDRTVMRTTEIRRDAARQIELVTFHYRWIDAKGRGRHQRVSFEMIAMWPRELRLLLERNGLRIERMWGNYDGSEVGGASPRIIARCALKD